MGPPSTPLWAALGAPILETLRFSKQIRKVHSPKFTAIQVVLRQSVRYPGTPGQFERKQRLS
jgi:hypothetical protein